MTDDDELLRDTPRALRERVERARKLPRQMQDDEYRKRLRDEDLAFAEVMSRGLDPKRSRRFRGRVILTVLCAPLGHEMANVYPTAYGLVFVPTVAQPPRPAVAPGSVLRRQDAFVRRVLNSTKPEYRGRQPIDRHRDGWVDRYHDDPETRRPIPRHAVARSRPCRRALVRTGGGVARLPLRDAHAPVDRR